MPQPGGDRLIVYLPGQNPKPELETHRRQLWRCLLEGVRRADPEISGALQDAPECFELSAWNDVFYSRHTDLQGELRWIDRVVALQEPTDEDVSESRSLESRITGILYSIVDKVPLLTSWFPDPHLKHALLEANRYFENHHHLAEEVREVVKRSLRAAFRRDARILLIGHSLGSVIAYDALWELSWSEFRRGHVATFLSLGSPLGTQFVQHRVLGAGRRFERRYPNNIRRWVNIAAQGDHISLDQNLEREFRTMLDLGYIRELRQHRPQIINPYRDAEGLNPHRAYGYLCHRETGQVICDWWKGPAEGA